MSRGTRQSGEERYPGSEQIGTPSVEKLPFDAWCICPKCGAYISANINYCPCGAKLPRRNEAGQPIKKIEEQSIKVEQTATHVAEKLPSGAWCVCPKCGAYISANIEYCFCGAKLPRRLGNATDNSGP